MAERENVPEKAAKLFPARFLFEDQAELSLNKRAEQFEPAFADRDPRMIVKLCFFLYRHPDCTMIIRVRHFSVYTVIPLYRGVSAQLIIRISG